MRFSGSHQTGQERLEGAQRSRRQPGWASTAFYLWLGLAQMAGAGLALMLLAREGVSARTLTAVVLTSLLSLYSRMLHRRRGGAQR